MFLIDKKQFELIKEYRNCFNEQLFRERYTEALDKYDVIVGDVSAERLRLKGFSIKQNDSFSHVSTIPDYLNESCNYNSPYFIVKRIK